MVAGAGAGVTGNGWEGAGNGCSRAVELGSLPPMLQRRGSISA